MHEYEIITQSAVIISIECDTLEEINPNRLVMDGRKAIKVDDPVIGIRKVR